MLSTLREDLQTASLPREKGAALITGLVMLLVMTVLGVAAMTSTITQEQLAGNYKRGLEAFHNSETGISDSLSQLNTIGVPVGGFDAMLAMPTYLSLSDVDANIFYSTRALDNDDGDADTAVDSDGEILLESRGSSGTALRLIRVRISLNPAGWGSNHAILTGESLLISGNPTVIGTNNAIHSNGNIMLSGTTSAGAVSASGTVSVPGSDENLGSITSGAADAGIPEINPADFRDAADFILGSDGRVRDQAGVILNPGGDPWNGWDWGVDKWTKSDSSVVDGTYYIESNAVLSGNPGEGAAEPWHATIIAEGSIEISGNPVIATAGAAESGIDNLLFVAGGDLKINGNANQSFEGVMAAHEQIDISGNPNLDGFIIAEGASDVHDYVDMNSISGDMQLTYDGLNTPFQDPLGEIVALSWEEILP